MMKRHARAPAKASDALAALAAPAHEIRLTVFRRLVTAGLLRSWRRQRQVFYAADYDGTRGLLTFPTHDCCQGHPEICGDLTRIAALPEPEDA